MKDELFIQLLLVSITVSPLILLLKVLGEKINKRYVMQWKYYVWLMLAIRLLIPWSPSLPVQSVEIVMPQESRALQEIIYIESEQPIVTEKNSCQQTQVDREMNGTQHQSVNLRGIFNTVQIVWLVGVMSYLGYHLTANWYTWRKLDRWSRPVKQEILQQVQDVFGTQDQIFPRHLSVMVNTQITGPMVVGLIEPKLYLPDRRFTREELRFVLLHEVTHYRRGDIWYKLLLLLVNGLHWFNPFVYMMCGDAEKDLECSCDSIVIQGIEKEARCRYAGLILEEASLAAAGSRMLTSNFYGGNGAIKARLQNILDARRKRRGVVILGAFSMAAVLGSGLWNISLVEGKAQEYSTDVIQKDTEREQSKEDMVWKDASPDKMIAADQAETGKTTAIKATELLAERDGLLLDGSGTEDRLICYRVEEETENYYVLAVFLDNGLRAGYRLPCNEAVASDDICIYTIPFLQSSYYQSIVVGLIAPQGETDYYILHVEVDEESQEALIIEDVAVLNQMKDSRNYENHQNTFIELPFYYVRHQVENGTYYHEALQQTTFKIIGVSEETGKGISAYVYWTGEKWKTYIE